MTEKERAKMFELEDAIIDRERRMFSLMCVIRGMQRGQDPAQCCIDSGVTKEEARVLGITNYEKAIEIRQTPG